MNKFLRFSLLTLLCAVFGFAYGQSELESPWSHTFSTTDKTFTADGTETLSGADWTLASDWVDPTQTDYNKDSSKGMKLGSNNKPINGFTLSSSSFPGTITQVSFTFAARSKSTINVAVTVGGSDFEATTTSFYNAQDLTEVVFTGSGSGEIVISIEHDANSTNKGAIYMGEVGVEFTESSNPVVAKPVISPEDGTVFLTESQEVTITTTTAGATIHYTVNGGAEQTYTGPFTITETSTITAYASASGMDNSAVATATITKKVAPESDWYESFDNMNGVGGNDGTWKGITQTPAFDNADQTWTVENTYAGFRCASIRKNGSLTTSGLNLAGNGTVNFSAEAWGTDTGDFYVAIVGGGTFVEGQDGAVLSSENTVAKVSLNKTGTWKEHSLEFTGITTSSEFKFYLAADKRGFLDEVYFVMSGEIPPTPVCTITTDLTELEVGQPIRWEDFTISYAEGLTEDDVDVDYEASSNFFNDLEQGLVPTEEGTATITFTFTYDGEGNYSDVEKTFIFNVVDNRQDPELAFTPNTITIVQGEEFETPVLSSVNDEYFFESGLATVESDNPDVAYWDDENGLQLGDELGTAVITVSYDGNEYSRLDAGYKSGEATLTVTVVDELPTEETATFDATIDLATTGNTAGAWSITKDGLTISADGGIGGNGTDYRIYKNATFTVSSTVGNITKIEFTAESSNPVSGFGTVEGLNGDTWTGNAESVSFTASEKQVRLTLVNITYEPNGEAPTTPICTMTQLLTNLELGKIYDIYELVQVEEAEGADPSKISRGIGGYGDSFDYIGGKYKADKEGPAQMTLTWEYFPGEGNENPYSKVEETFYFTIAEPVEYQFDFNAIENLPTSSTSSTDGDITSDLTIEEDGVTLVISPSTSSTPNRWWSTNNGPQLRVYGGTLTFSSEENISKIELYNTKWNDDNSADSGELTNSGSVATWTGSAKTVVITIAGNTQLDKVVVEKAVEVVPVTISASGKATLYYAEKTLKVAEGVTAYTAVKGASTITLTALEDGIIPAGVPVVVSGTEGSYEFEVMTNSTASFEGQNDLVGVEVDTKDEEAGYKYYVLSWKNKNKLPEEVGFYWQSGSKGLWANVKAHQAYMKVPEGVAPSDANGFSFTFDETTDITTIDGDSTLDMNAPMYNLSGQRVDNSYRGVVIQNGKKVIKK